ncbi:F0F1 ATP synthase subunit A [Demequina sp. SYSU T00192]|uniref:ATP synthase subunit a n=1 Tax=Demequina litoralis TaxID=3051660 RepID=A0ABT8G6R0_9MICO|nr:F0F1 ATP synthase subunit A [Demequina sp. SYSU T00192]MDN4474838.1 F0F1 ATP synthase subunit A [Demequina sp. SYSU T00192]
MFSSDGFHAPSIAEFFPPAIFGDGTIYEFNRIMLIRVIAAVALLAVFWIAASRAKVVPNRFQGGIEFLLDFVKDQIVEPVMGHEGKKFLPFLTTLFLSIVAFNITGVIPFLNIAGTSLIGLPLVMALWVYVMYLFQGVKKHGLGGYLKNSLFPPGVPWPIYFLLTPIEALQVFILRPATLALRLAANMIAGHLLLVLCFAATQYFFFEAAGAMKAMGAVTFAAGFAFVLFEIFVALLQAYVFTMLSAVYLNMALEEEH